MPTDLERAFSALHNKNSTYDALWAYYDGDQPVVYTNRRLRDIFKGLDARFTQNWCAVVVDSLLERIRLTNFTVGDEYAQRVLDALWAATELNLEADDAHEAALITGEAFIIVWRDDGEDGSPGPVQCYYNDPRLCHVFYDAENPRRKSFAAKWWDTDDGRRRLTLYYRDRLEYYISRGKAKNVSSAKSFEPFGDEPVVENPFGVIPVFHLRTKRRAVSELVNAIPLQNGVNKLLIDMMVAAEFGAFRQRYVISNAESLGQLKNAPNEIWDLPAGDGLGQATQVGEFAATDLNNYLSAIDKLASSIGIITRTPRHYFFSQGGDPSGEALIAMEAPLNKKAQDRIQRFASTWRQVAAFMLMLSGVQVDKTAITPVFERPETIQPFTQAQTRQIGVAAGIPLRTQLRNEGWSEAQLEQMEADRQAEQAAAQASLARALLEQQRRFDQNQAGGQ